jgi:transglutaminase-like putative cysteine protease
MRLKLIITVMFVLVLSAAALAGQERAGEVTVKFDFTAQKGSDLVRLWMPYPISGESQVIRDLRVKGNNDDSALYHEPESEAIYLYAEWNGKPGPRQMEMRFHVTGREIRHRQLKDNGQPVPPFVRKYLAPNQWVPTDGKVLATALEITRDRKGILDKSRAISEWVVANTYRDPTINGCGIGDVEVTLAKRGGKCADISSVYVALARAAGVPARDVFGIRVGDKPEKDITKGFHCWAEFYLPGTGWVPVDPADVRKVMLKKKLDLKAARPVIDYYFGSINSDHIALSRSERGVTFVPPQKEAPLSYFMYPYAEADGKALDYFDPKAFGYSLSFKADRT